MKLSPTKAAKRQRIAKFIKSVAEGKNYTQSAIEAGYKPSRAQEAGSGLSRDPEVQSALELALKKNNLEAARALKEIDYGLKHAELGKHDSYLDKLLKLNKMIGSETNNTTNVQMNFIDIIAEQARQRGLIPSESEPTP